MSAPRLQRARERLGELGVDVLLLSNGADLPYLTGYEAMPLERLTMLVLPAEGDAELLIPRLEAPRVDADGSFEVVPWDEHEDPVALVARRVGNLSTAAIGDQTWARFVLALQGEVASLALCTSSDVLAPLRAVKDADEIDALTAAAHAVDAVAFAMRDVSFAGRTELDLHRELVDRMIAAGHQRSNFAIVAAGANAASPHHEPTDRLISAGDVVLCDFGGTMRGYCSDITRMFAVGDPAPEIERAYDVLVEAQEVGVAAATVGTAGEDVDAAARQVLADAGYGDAFIHRLGHGIGAEAHEAPYLVHGNREPLMAGNTFSIEPGIYLPGRFGLRLEDIVAATDTGPQRLNDAPRDLPLVS